MSDKISDDHRTTVCRMGQASACCRYLIFGKYFECGKNDKSIKSTIDSRVKTMNAKANNCDGWGVNSEINKIVSEKRRILSYHSYPVGTYGSFHIESTEDKDSVVYWFVENVLNDALKALNMRRDNKEAVKLEIEGFDRPIYAVAYDFQRILCFEINESRGSKEYKIST